MALWAVRRGGRGIGTVSKIMWVSSPVIVTEDRACPVIIPDQPCPGAACRRSGSQLPPAGCPGLREYLLAVPDPRDPRGVRHWLAWVLLASVAAVLAGARSLAAIGEWVADAPPGVPAGGRGDHPPGAAGPPPGAATGSTAMDRRSGW